jgi:hypothetical protein
MTVNALPMQEDLIIPLGVEVWKSDVYTLSFNEFEVGQEVYLEDLQSGKTFQINPEDEYHFVANSGDELHRFNLHFGNALNISELQTKKEISIYAFNHKVYFSANYRISGMLEVIDISGKQVYSTDISNQKFHSFVLTQEGIYLVRFIGNTISNSTKIFIP